MAQKNSCPLRCAATAPARKTTRMALRRNGGRSWRSSRTARSCRPSKSSSTIRWSTRHSLLSGKLRTHRQDRQAGDFRPNRPRLRRKKRYWPCGRRKRQRLMRDTTRETRRIYPRLCGRRWPSLHPHVRSRIRLHILHRDFEEHRQKRQFWLPPLEGFAAERSVALQFRPGLKPGHFTGLKFRTNPASGWSGRGRADGHRPDARLLLAHTRGTGQCWCPEPDGKLTLWVGGTANRKREALREAVPRAGRNDRAELKSAEAKRRAGTEVASIA